MRSLAGRQVLITQSRLKHFAGSEIVTMELAREFASTGAKVTILTNYLDDPIKTVLGTIPNTDIILTTTKAANDINVSDYDLIWVHHSLLTKEILTQLVEARQSRKRPYVVFNHMSYQEPMEFPIMYTAEDTLADVVTFNAEEIRDRILETGVTFSSAKQAILGNPAPDEYFDNTSVRIRQTDGRPRDIAVVSNHIPHEVREAVDHLKSLGIESVDFYGKEEGSVPKLLTKNTLRKYDLVVTIGKTVQYCIAANVPVYCYDRFGGPGYLTLRNFAKSRYHNFSGRGFTQKSSEKITKEISEGYPRAVDNFSQLRNAHAPEFSLSWQLEIVLGFERNSKPIVKNDADIACYSAYLEIMNGTFPANFKYLYQLHDLELDYSNYRRRKTLELEQATKEYKQHVARLNNEIESYKNTKTYRLYKKYSSLRKKLRKS